MTAFNDRRPAPKKKPHRYVAYKEQGSIHEGKWKSYVVMFGDGKSQVIEAPGYHPTKKAALEAIKGQHPNA